jgi:(p)ppGpp synthase/HD superfamily hydrolase
MSDIARYGKAGIIGIYAAEVFATAAHGAIDQRRKYTNAPYIMHPEAVVKLVQTVDWHTHEMVCAAWLHDVLEDTKVQTSDIDRFFGGEIGTMVYRLTDCGHEVGNRAKRKAMDRQRLAESSREVQTIKVADLIDNTPYIVQHDPEFARVYLREMRELLDVLRDADTVLWGQANTLLKQSTS